MGAIRLLLAISVLPAHAGPLFGFYLADSYLVVQLFYIISGFYMSMVLEEKYVGSKQAIWTFYQNRMLRLMPTYWIVLVLSILSVFVLKNLKGMSLDYIWTTLSGANISTILVLIWGNIFLFGQDVIFLQNISLNGGLEFVKSLQNAANPAYRLLIVPQAWSLSVELCFYVVAPFIVRRSWLMILPIILLSFKFGSFLLANGFSSDPWVYRFFPTQICYFLIGTISFKFYRLMQKKQKWGEKYFKIVGWILMLILAGLIVAYSFLPIEVEKRMQLMIILVAFSVPFIFIATKNYKFDRFLGDLSYPFYISHYLLVNHVLVPNAPAWVLLLSLLFSILILYFVEYPIEIYRQARINKMIWGGLPTKEPG